MNELDRNEPCPDCGRFANRGIAVDAVLIRDGRILLVKRGREPGKGMWALPGGFVEWDETTEAAVGREVAEETGLRIISSQLIGVYSLPNRHPKQVITAAYVVEVEPGEPTAGDDAEAAEWFDLDSLPEQVAFDHRVIIEDSKKL